MELNFNVTRRGILKTILEMNVKMSIGITEHCIKTSYYALRIAKKLDLEKEKIEEIIVQGLLHDIGFYSAQSNDIFNWFNNNHINDKENCIESYIRLKSFSPYSSFAFPVLYCNYPIDHGKAKTLFNKEIPISSKIIYVANQIDFLSNKKNKDAIIRHLSFNTGTKFEQEIVDIASDLLANDIMEDKDMLNIILNNISDKVLSIEDITKGLEFLAYTLDFASSQTSTHSFDVFYITRYLNNYFDLPHKQKIINELSAIVHDVGKLGVDLNIIEKKGKLNDEEYIQVMDHVVFTKQMLTHLGDLTDLMTPAYNHHERLNGSGYPLGLKEDVMTFSDFILQVADIFGALIQSRSYKEVFPKDKVIAILTAESAAGKIHSGIVDVIVNNYDDAISYVILNRKKHITMHFNINNQRKVLKEKFK